MYITLQTEKYSLPTNATRPEEFNYYAFNYTLKIYTSKLLTE